MERASTVRPAIPGPAIPGPVEVRGRAPRGVVQRKCACGGKPGAGGSCEECNKEATTLQLYSATHQNPAISILPAAGVSGFDATPKAAPASRVSYSLVQRAAMTGS